MHVRSAFPVVLWLLSALPGSAQTPKVTCDSLAALALPQGTVTAAQLVSAGAFQPPPGPRAGEGPTDYRELPAFCRVAATLTPTSDSLITVEVWLPVANWNGKFMGVGNGGWAGSINHNALSSALGRGYAAASTDTGHEGPRATFALGHPEKLIDYAHRAVHEMTVKAKSVIAAFYGRGPRFSYWNGCSTGGKQGLTAAQRYPADYDGIIAGAPANYMLHLHASQIWVAQAVHKEPASFIPPAKYPAIHAAVLDACDAKDGVRDGVLEDPSRCRFDPASMACKSDDGPTCLTAEQVEAARKIYAGPVNPRTGERVFPGLAPGSELGWHVLAGPEPLPFGIDTFKYVVFGNPEWDWRTLNWDGDIGKADAVDGGTNNAINPDLRPFFARGGKLFLFHGWNDEHIAPGNTIDYYSSVVAALGGVDRIDASMRLFMVPGMTHCRGGEGCSTFDRTAAIERWVEEGLVPNRIEASRIKDGKVDRTRPLCPYPQVAQYKGAGSTDDSANFACGPVAQIR